MCLDQLFQRDRHSFFDIARLVHVAGDAEQLGSGIPFAPDAGEPFCAAAQNVRRNGNGFDIVHGAGTAIQAGIGRERRLQARLALLAFQAFQQRGFLATDISACAVADIDVEIPAGPGGVLADQPRVISLADRLFERDPLIDIFAADIDVAGVRAHRVGGDQAALDQQVRIVAHDFPVLARARLGFVSVDDQIVRPFADFLGHEGPFQAGRETGAATAAQARRLHLVDDPVLTEAQQVGRGIPRAPLLRGLKPRIVNAV